MNKVLLTVTFVGGLLLGAVGGVIATKSHYEQKADEEVQTMADFYSNRPKKQTVQEKKETRPYHPVKETKTEAYVEFESEDTVTNEAESPRFVSEDEVILGDDQIECSALTYYLNDDVLIDEFTNEKVDNETSDKMLGECRLLIHDSDIYYVYSPRYNTYYEIYATFDAYVPDEYDITDDTPTRQKIPKRGAKLE